jgi:hypothetical protein
MVAGEERFDVPASEMHEVIQHVLREHPGL